MMGQGILLMLAGLFIITISQTFAKMIAMKYESNSLELILKVIIFLFGVVFVSIGALIALHLIEFYQPESSQSVASSVIFLAFGIICIGISPILTNYLFKKYPDNEYIQLIGKRGFYLFYIGVGFFAITSGMLGLFGLL